MGWKYHCKIVIVILLLSMPGCAGMNSSTFFEYINSSSKIVTGVDEIIYDDVRGYTPNTPVQSSQHIRGRIDIIGFEGVVKIGNISYSDNSDPPSPVIKYDLWSEGITSDEYITNNNVDFIKITDERITTENNVSTVEIDIHLKWHHSVRKSRTINGKSRPYVHKDYKNEYTTFSASRQAPQPYPEKIVPAPSVKIFNTTIAPKTIIHLHKAEYILGYHVKYNNESVEYFYKCLLIEDEDNGMQIANTTQMTSQSIYEDSDVFSRAGNNIIINSTEINNNNLKIYTIDPYKEYELNYTISNYTETHILEKIQISGAFSLLMTAWVILFLIKYHRG